MKLIYRIQNAPIIDSISDDGHVGVRTPYPFYVKPDGRIMHQDFWRGTATLVIGFQRDLANQTIDLWWREAVEHPELALNMYMVTKDDGEGFGDWAVHSTAVTSIDTYNIPEDSNE